ncbi:cobyrinate a,c-diamide synthase [Chitinophaga varians]|uniref:cobyrinate a,c-diamide synthase n=1 Tax=Chitinophaga varians TaxID=2202339 RepID=UPI00165FFB88|nr:cobyrinate a,c-diamide synthase [Chitinophaga varians]MBC9908970.1 cobyrinate a,c-diamide synthase [Chitinophaga varians]
MQPQFLIAAPHSGAGKTTVTLAVLRALQRKGLRVQPFKCGPDYIDPRLHSIAAGRPGINLDRYMMSDEHVRNIYAQYSAQADVSVTEGVMGLFDGAVKMEGSSAELAMFLDIPVILVVNAKAMAYSAAALLYGYKNFSPGLRIAGVIFNFVSTASHYRFLQDAAADVGLTALGYLPENISIKIPSRHLGLHISADHDYDQIINDAADHLSQYIDLDKLMEMTRAPRKAYTTENKPAGRLRIAVAQDEAFNFIYPQNIQALSSFGEITYFSPLQDQALPAADVLYLPGGYPELHLPQLTANTALRTAVKAFKGKILAECGGMMYLGAAIHDESGQPYEMCDVLPMSTTMQQKKLALGYREVEFDSITLRGHEFHYSTFVDTPALTDMPIRVSNARGEMMATPVFYDDRIFASYLHFYFGDNLPALRKILSL